MSKNIQERLNKLADLAGEHEAGAHVTKLVGRALGGEKAATEAVGRSLNIQDEIDEIDGRKRSTKALDGFGPSSAAIEKVKSFCQKLTVGGAAAATGVMAYQTGTIIGWGEGLIQSYPTPMDGPTWLGALSASAAGLVGGERGESIFSGMATRKAGAERRCLEAVGAAANAEVSDALRAALRDSDTPSDGGVTVDYDGAAHTIREDARGSLSVTRGDEEVWRENDRFLGGLTLRGKDFDFDPDAFADRVSAAKAASPA